MSCVLKPVEAKVQQEAPARQEALLPVQSAPPAFALNFNFPSCPVSPADAALNAEAKTTAKALDDEQAAAVMALIGSVTASQAVSDVRYRIFQSHLTNFFYGLGKHASLQQLPAKLRDWLRTLVQGGDPKAAYALLQSRERKPLDLKWLEELERGGAPEAAQKLVEQRAGELHPDVVRELRDLIGAAVRRMPEK